VYVLLLNADGTVKSQQKISNGIGGLDYNTFGFFGSAVSSVGDLDGDDLPELAVGARNDENGDFGEGAVYILSLAGPVGVTATPTGGSSIVDESGTTDTFTIVLDVQPNSDVVLHVISDDTGEVTVDKATLMFTNTDWNTPQAVVFKGVDDDIVDGYQNSLITLSIDDANSDDLYDTLGDETIIVTTTDDDGVPGNVDGDTDFDANDSFLIHLVNLSGTDLQIEQSRGTSPLTPAQIRAAVTQLNASADVDGDQDFDANDSFLIHLVNLSGTDLQIEQSRGSSQLAATQIRANVNALGGGSAASQGRACQYVLPGPVRHR